jgi:gliding motility-associated-like protein
VCGVQKIDKFVLPSGILIEPSFRFEPRCDSGFVRLVNTSVTEPPGTGNVTWFFGDGNFSTDAMPRHSYAAAGVYDVKLHIAVQPACLNDSVTQPFNNQPISLSVTSPVVVDEGASVQLNTVSNATSYRWSPPDFLSDTVTASPTVRPYDDRVYYVTARNGGGCSATDSIILKINPIRDIFVPEIFTPNNDGRNDVFTPVFSRRLRLENFAVYNRWGQLMYSSNRHSNLGWNGFYKGVDAAADTYVWQLTVYNREGQKIIRKGTVVLVR